MNAEEILSCLVAFPSIVGSTNGEIVAWIRAYAENCGAAVSVHTGPEGDRANLFATIGPADKPGYVLSGHMDVVPANEPGWTSDPFRLRRDGEKLYGRGSSDMKGFLAAALAALPGIATRDLARPLHLAFSYDEEAGCRGVPHLIAALPSLCAPPLGCIVGEPSGLAPIRAHKGKAAARLTITGRAVHSSRPDEGLNAIHAMAAVMNEAFSQAGKLQGGSQDPDFTPPYSSLQIGVIQGGQALNIVPESCSIEIEARAIPGIDPDRLLAPVRAVAEALAGKGFGVDWSAISSYPGLSPAANGPLADLLSGLTGRSAIAAVSFGTEAGLFEAAGLPAIICGPGDIGRAHRPDEFIKAGELADCQRLIEKIGERLGS